MEFTRLEKGFQLRDVSDEAVASSSALDRPINARTPGWSAAICPSHAGCQKQEKVMG